MLLTGLMLLAHGAGCSNDPYPPPGDKKIIYSVLGEDPHGLDPVQTGDTLSAGVASQIYESLYEYHFLKRPYELKPALAAAMPEVSEDGLTYTIPVKRGIYFQDDPCFEATDGEGRELTAGDFVYAVKRLADAATDPTGWWLLQGKIRGLDEFHDLSVERAAMDREMDYSMSVEGLRAPDSYTLQIKLKERYPQLKYALAMPYTAATPREAVEYYGKDFHNQPVGTGPFRLKEWSRRWRLILERNPEYRDDFYPAEGEPGDRAAGLLEDAGKKVPIVDEAYYTIMYEAQPAWLYFKQGYRDASGISKDNFEEAITPNKELSPEFREKGIRLVKMPEAMVTYIGFNMDDPVVGGENRKLRQALSLAYDTEWRIEHFYNGRAVSAQSPIPPGIFGYDPDYRNPYKGYDPERARELLAEAGYPGGVGEDGEPLKIAYDLGSAGPGVLQRARAFAREMQDIGVEVEIRTNTWAEFLRKIREGRTQAFGVGWILDYPDPENFLQLLYGPNGPRPNNARYDNPEYNRLYEKMKAMPNSPERRRIIRKMVDIVAEDAPWIPGIHPVSYTLYHQWYRNAKPHGITGGYLKYRDVDVELRDRLRRKWNSPNHVLLFIFLGVVGGISVLLGIIGRERPGRAARS